jgi:hypothetical protein
MRIRMNQDELTKSGKKQEIRTFAMPVDNKLF